MLRSKAKNPLHIKYISQLIDKDLTVISIYLKRKSMNEVCDGCLTILIYLSKGVYVTRPAKIWLAGTDYTMLLDDSCYSSRNQY